MPCIVGSKSDLHRQSCTQLKDKPGVLCAVCFKQTVAHVLLCVLSEAAVEGPQGPMPACGRTGGLQPGCREPEGASARQGAKACIRQEGRDRHCQWVASEGAGGVKQEVAAAVCRPGRLAPVE